MNLGATVTTRWAVGSTISVATDRHKALPAVASEVFLAEDDLPEAVDVAGEADDSQEECANGRFFPIVSPSKRY